PISLDSKGATSSRRNARTRDPGVKVDIVADDGRQWIRVNTIKNSRILAELREMDSYSTGSDSDSEIDDIPSSRVVDAGGNEGNSLLRMGRSLLDAALVNPVNYSDCSVTPTVTMLLPRLDLSNACDFDPRIQETVVLLRKWGIDTRTGEEAISLDENLHERFASHGPSTRELRITTRINLDLSMLIALVSDLTHSPLPSNEDEARQRFVPSESYRLWKNGRIASGYRTGAQDDGSDIKYSRALTTQVIQEMRSSLLLDIHDRLQSASPGAIRYEGAVTDQPVQHSTLSDVEFWTTPDA
ncbi:hypothetical protein PUNSTDRAFT_23300, partial [Punctularia strigosozonata HHB-11173 SS5]|uniref:uncharacterized protein n=1 Tax=Punctularia strigosozonata (strain HHB-11173) TaxID=741275 RepID=UPI0004416703